MKGNNMITYDRRRVRRAVRGAKMRKGNGWKLVATRGRERYFVGTLLYTHNFDGARVAVFSVPKRVRKA